MNPSWRASIVLVCVVVVALALGAKPFHAQALPTVLPPGCQGAYVPMHPGPNEYGGVAFLGQLYTQLASQGHVFHPISPVTYQMPDDGRWFWILVYDDPLSSVPCVPMTQGASQPISSGGCTTPDPFVSIGGGICQNGGWRPRGL